MTETLYPWGYGKTLVTEARLWELARLDLCDPVTRECIKAWIRSRGGQMGIGGAVRFVQPDKPGFAEDGRSFHQLQQWISGPKNFAAFDVVVRNGNDVHRAPRWDEVPKQGSGHPDIANYRVHANVTGEPWHIQHMSIDGWQGWVNAGRRRPSALPVNDGTPTPTPTPTPKPQPEILYPPAEVELTSPSSGGVHTTWNGVPGATQYVLEYEMQGNPGHWVQYVVPHNARQHSMTALNDQFYRVRVLARNPDTASGWSTTGYVPSYKSANDIGSRTLRVAAPRMQGPDVQFVQNVLKQQGLSISADGYYGPSTRDKVKILQGWNKLEQDGVVGPKTWAVIKQY